MKIIIALFLLSVPVRSTGQSITSLQSAITSSDQKVQAIHTYPFEVKDGDCHWVEVTSVSLNGDKITITETWSNWMGSSATTVLTGKLKDDTAEGTWKSSYSSGNWNYNFTTGAGTWNKSQSSFDSFRKFEPLRFKIVANRQIKDGFFPCE